jgi:hypothetical protein
MVDAAADYSGSVPEHYDRIMGPAQFDAYGADLRRATFSRSPAAPGS